MYHRRGSTKMCASVGIARLSILIKICKNAPGASWCFTVDGNGETSFNSLVTSLLIPMLCSSSQRSAWPTHKIYCRTTQ